MTTCDVLIIGAGPAGTTIASLLATQGWNVHILEKNFHPRFHIGESLLPHSLPILDRLGVLSDVEKIGIRKFGVELISPNHEQSVTLYFSQATSPDFPYAYQVRRSEFDRILAANAAKCGAILHEGIQARDITHLDSNQYQVLAEDQQGRKTQWMPRFLVDASGRDSFLSNRWFGKDRDPQHNTAAIYGHFAHAKRHTGKDEGNISIFWFGQGWIWFIPFKDGITSIGAVCWPEYLKSRKDGLDQFLWDTLSLCPQAFERVKHATLVLPATATSNYSYRSRTMSGENFLMLGDAIAFIDPVFSTGVHLALNSALLGASYVEARLTQDANAEPLRVAFERNMNQAYRNYSWFIHRFMQPAFQNLFMNPQNMFRMKESVLSLLGGDVFGKTPITWPILIFKTIYYMQTLLAPFANFETFKKRRQGIQVSAEGES